MPDPVALVLGVVAGYLARTHPLRWPDLLHALLARLIHTGHRMGRIVRPGIHFQHVSIGNEVQRLLHRNTPVRARLGRLAMWLRTVVRLRTHYPTPFQVSHALYVHRSAHRRCLQAIAVFASPDRHPAVAGRHPLRDEYQRLAKVLLTTLYATVCGAPSTPTSVGSRSVFSLVCQQQDLRIPPAVGSMFVRLYQPRSVPFFVALRRITVGNAELDSCTPAHAPDSQLKAG